MGRRRGVKCNGGDDADTPSITNISPELMGQAGASPNLKPALQLQLRAQVTGGAQIQGGKESFSFYLNHYTATAA